jgi:hypothetical protein
VAVVVASSLFYVVLGCVAPGLAASFTAKPLIDRLAAEIGPDDACAVWGKYLPSAAFYLPRPPWLVGTRPELRYGDHSSAARRTSRSISMTSSSERQASGYVLTTTGQAW